MNLKKSLLIFFLVIPLLASAQDQAENKTDPQGRKQGHWIKYYPDKTRVLYEGYFVDDHPAGEFKRYYEDGTMKSILIYTTDGKEAEATIYHPNGYIA